MMSLNLDMHQALVQNYGSGFGLGYQSRFNLAQFEGMNLSAVGGLSLNYFGLNKDTFNYPKNPTLAAIKGWCFYYYHRGWWAVKYLSSDFFLL